MKGLRELVEFLKARRNAHAEGFADGVVYAAYFLMRKSLEIVPMDTGYLASTSHVTQSERGFDKVAKLVYTAAYSIYVHERLDLAHGAVYNRKYAEDIALGRKRPRRPQEQAKFIETPLRNYRKDLIGVVRKEMAERARQEKLAISIATRGAKPRRR